MVWQELPDSLTRVAIATARAGNVIGGGDWAAHRIVPDAMRASPRRRSMDRPQQLSLQLKGMERLVNADSGATLLCLDISDPAGMARLLADPVKSQLTVGI